MQIRKFSIVFAYFLILAAVFSVAQEGEKAARISPGLSAAILESGDQDTIPVWIYFKDKGPKIPSLMAKLEESLPLQVVKRRLRQGERGRLRG